MNIRLRHLLAAAAMLAMNATAQITGYEYWLDGNLDGRQAVSCADGNIRHEVDVSALAPGIHRYHFRAQDAQGRWSGTNCRYFLVLGRDLTASQATVCRHAVDGGAWTETKVTEGTAQFDVPAAGLAPGIHRLLVSVGDNAGRWSGTFVHNFLSLGPDYSGNRTCAYEYWIDGDVAARRSGATADGNVSIELDAAEMSYGLHNVTLRVSDEAGRWSSPLSRYFVKPEPSLAGNMITAYEYWFNREPVRHVEVDPANPFIADGLLVNVDVYEPNDIGGDYTVDWNSMTAYVPDDVVFGIRFADAAGRYTEARTDTFAYDVPVTLDVKRLSWGDTATVDKTSPGMIYAYDVEAQAGDTLVWSATARCTVDIYEYGGNRLARLKGDTPPCYKMEVGTGGRLLALVYGAGSDTLGVCCDRIFDATGISMAEAGINVSARDGYITVSGAYGGRCAVYSVGGYVAAWRGRMADKETFNVGTGVFVVVLTDASGNTFRQTFAVSK